MIKLSIEVEPDRVLIESQVIYRPDYISRSQWMVYWEKLERTQGQN